MIVDEFVENPKFLSMFADTKIHWGNFLTLLHLLMIKHGERKFHLASTDKREFKNLCSLAGKLELEWKVITGTSLFEYQKQEKPLPQVFYLLEFLIELKLDPLRQILERKHHQDQGHQ